MSQMFNAPYNPVVGATGLILDGAKWYFYLTNSTTPASVYTTAALNVAHANPVVADSLGRFDPIFLNPAIQYRAILKTAAGVAVPDCDFDPVNDTLQAQLSASSGSSLIGFLQSGTGAVASTVQAQLRFFIRPEQFGAVGDGSTDDTTAIQEAFTYAATLGATVLFDARAYKTTAKLTLSRKVNVRGAGWSFPTAGLNPAANRDLGTQIYKAHNDTCIEVIGTAAYDECGSIVGITVTSNKTTYTTGDAFVIDQVGSYNIEDCQAWSCGGNGFTIGVTAGDVTGHTLLRRLYVNNCGGKAYYLRAKWVRVNHCLSDGCTHGLYLQDAPETHIIDCHFEGFTTAGVKIAGASGSSRFVGKTFLGNTASAVYGIQIDSVAGNSFIDCSGLKMQGPSATTAITFTGALVAATSGTLTGNWAGTTGSYGIYFSDGSAKTATLTNGSAAVSWTGAVTADAAASAMSNPTAVAIDIAGSGALGVKVLNCEINNWATAINNVATRVRIIGNDFYQNGLPIYSNASDSRYQNNVFDTTVGLYEIDHVSGTVGLWSGNTFGTGKLIKPTAGSSSAGSYNGVTVKNNNGFVTRNSGVTGSIATGTAISHGLVGVPANDILMTANTAAVTSMPQLTATAATTFTFGWAGTTPAQWSWQAHCPCDF